MKVEKYELALVNHPLGYVFGCAKCRTILAHGTWTVGLVVGKHRYMVGHNPPLECCGESKKIGRVFLTEEEAKVLSDQVADILNREGTTESLVLYEFAFMRSTATH